LPNKIVFETAAVSDTFKKANRIAPTKGRNLESYAGFLLEVDPANSNVLLRSTDGGVFYMEWITPLEVEGDAPFVWRVPSNVTTAILNTLPQGAGNKVTFQQDGGRIIITSKRTKGSVRLIDTSNYPTWDTFDPVQVSSVEGFGSRLDQVAWAVSRKEIEVMSGVYIDGQNIVATNGQRLATAPFSMPIPEESVVVPMAVLAPIVSQMVEMKAGVIGNYLCLLPNQYTQIKCVLMGDDFPNVSAVMKKETTDAIMFNKEITLATLQRILTIGSKDRQGHLDITIGDGEMKLFAQDEGADEEIEDVISLAGQCEHPPMTIRVGPDNFQNAINKAPGLMVMMHYDPQRPLGFLRFEGDAGYKCWIPPRRAVKNDEQQVAA
jgi:DNA polymerase III sliding clamp (beta) subunit (PCNA family)